MGYEPIKEETKEQYLKIWIHYSVGHFNQEQLAKLFECSQDTVANAIKWCAEHRIQFTTPILAEAAKEAVEDKLRELKSDLIRIKESDTINWNAAIGLNRLIKENEELLRIMQGVIQKDKSYFINFTQNNQRFDYKILDELAKEKQVNDEIRSFVNTLDDKQKKLFLLTMDALESEAKIKIEIEENDSITNIQLSKI